MKKIFESVKLFFVIMKEVTLHIIATLLAKDPCKKCLVSACCSNKCEEKVILENLIMRGDTLRSRKLFALFFAIYVPTIFIILVWHTIDYLT
jgi:hypothetical protein